MHYDYIQINLFPFCNLNCKFCYERTILKNGFNKTKDYYINKCKESIIKNNLTYDTVYMLGGELFYDKDNDFQNIIDFCKWLSPKKLILHTNLLFDFNTNPLFLFLKDSGINFELYTSYDLENRYRNKEQEDLFFSNLEKLYDLNKEIIEIPIVLTENILLNKVNMDNIFKLYNDSRFCIEFKLDLNGYSDDITKDFHTYYVNFIKNFPKSRNIQIYYDTGFNKGEGRFCSCYQKNHLSLIYHSDFELNTNNLCEGKIKSEGTEEQLNISYRCADCNYNNKCTDICPEGLKTMRLFNDTKCYIKSLYEYLDKKDKKVKIIKSLQ